MTQKELDLHLKISEYQRDMLDWLFNNDSARDRDNDSREQEYAQGGF